MMSKTAKKSEAITAYMMSKIAKKLEAITALCRSSQRASGGLPEAFKN